MTSTPDARRQELVEKLEQQGIQDVNVLASIGRVPGEIEKVGGQ